VISVNILFASQFPGGEMPPYAPESIIAIFNPEDATLSAKILPAVPVQQL
jgi:hypothetical protein